MVSGHRQKNLLHCELCFSKEIRNLLANNDKLACLQSRNRCCLWTMVFSSLANQNIRPSQIKIAGNYPTTVHDGSPCHPLCQEVPVRHIKQADQSFEWLLCVLRFAAHNVLYLQWNNGVTSSYLKSCEVPDCFINAMHEHIIHNDPSQDPNTADSRINPEY